MIVSTFWGHVHMLAPLYASLPLLHGYRLAGIGNDQIRRGLLSFARRYVVWARRPDRPRSAA